MSTRLVRIPRCDTHEGIFSMDVELEWTCPVCGGPRGEPRDGLSYDGSRRLGVHQWSNPCGHVDTYAEIRAGLAKAEGKSKARGES